VLTDLQSEFHLEDWHSICDHSLSCAQLGHSSDTVTAVGKAPAYSSTLLCLTELQPRWAMLVKESRTWERPLP